MKVVTIHNFYQSSAPSGENTVFRNEVKLLEERGVEVVSYTRTNDDILDYRLWEKVKLPFRNIWSLKTYRELKTILRREKPDICHFHNIFYLVSPSGYYAAKSLGIPIVQTFHNFRFFCTNGLLFLNGKPCEKCLGRTAYRSFLLKCHRKSISYSVAIAVMEHIHQLNKTLNKHVDAFIALTDFGKDKLIKGGLSKNKIYVKPNFIFIENGHIPRSENYVLFVGRLSPGKGMMTLLKAWEKIQSLRFNLKIIGQSDEEQLFEQYVSEHDIRNVEFLGQQTHDYVIESIKKCLFLVFPSEWYETFGMSIIEAFAAGKPVVASNLGAMASIVKHKQTGLLFEAGNSLDLAEKITCMLLNSAGTIKMGENARREYESKYSPERNFDQLMAIYQRVLDNKKKSN